MNNTTCVRTLALLLALAIGGCGGGGGGGGGGGPTPSDDVGTVGVLITDATSHQWDEAIATITSVSLIGDDGQVTLFQGSRTLDLLKLSDFSELFAVSDEVPADTYGKIRLQLSNLILNDIDPDTGALLDTEQPQLVGNGKIDLVPRSPFVVVPGDIIFVELDFDMDKSLKITETGSGNLIVRPVVFVDIRTERLDGRLTRVHGEIDAISEANAEFELCQTNFASQDDDDLPGFDDDHCMIVVVDDDTGIFDEEGLPIELEDLGMGDEVTVIGRLQPLDDDDFDFLFEALVIEQGPVATFQRIRGVVASAYDFNADRFELDIDPGQGIDAESLPVQLFDTSRIFHANGEELDREDLVVGLGALVDGILIVDGDEHIRSPLVILEDESAPEEETLEGTIIAVEEEDGELLVNDGTADRCVDVTEAEIFLIDDSDGLSSSRGDITDLAPGQEIAAFGEEEVDGCFIAATLLVEGAGDDGEDDE